MFKKLVVGNLSFDLIALARLKELGNLFKDIRRLQTSLDGAFIIPITLSLRKFPVSSTSNVNVF